MSPVPASRGIILTLCKSPPAPSPHPGPRANFPLDFPAITAGSLAEPQQ